MTCAGKISTAGAAITDAEFAAFQALVLRVSGISLTDSKRQLVLSRLAKRLRDLGCESYGEYYRLVTEGDPLRKELQRMINCITTNKTDFFREPHHFTFLRDRVFAEHEAERAGRPLRIWSSACSSGEEPYSIVMQALRHYGYRAATEVQVFASDIDTEVLRRAEAGVYAIERVEAMTEEEIRRHFLRGTGEAMGQVQVRPEVRALATFKRINLTESRWPIPDELDVIFCRNVIIYFDRETQERLMRSFAAKLRPGGYLILGHSENLLWLADIFEPLGQTVYRVREGRTKPRMSARGAKPSEIRLVVGDVKASRDAVALRTILGSCVAACLFDPTAGVGGMNHFLLPEGDEAGHLPNRFGVQAMELLINEIMHLGGDRRRLQAKVFGAGNVVAAITKRPSVGERNATFIRAFLAAEQIPLVAEKLEGRQPLEVVFYPRTGRVLVRELESTEVRAEEREAARYLQTLQAQATRRLSNDVLLFGRDP